VQGAGPGPARGRAAGAAGGDWRDRAGLWAAGRRARAAGGAGAAVSQPGLCAGSAARPPGAPSGTPELAGWFGCIGLPPTLAHVFRAYESECEHTTYKQPDFLLKHCAVADFLLKHCAVAHKYVRVQAKSLCVLHCGTLAGTLCRLFSTSAGLKRGCCPAQVVLRQLFERLGSTYIKLGQFIASSPTLCGPGPPCRPPCCQPAYQMHAAVLESQKIDYASEP